MLQKFIKKLPFHSRWRLAFRTLPFVVIVILAKLSVHSLGYEFLTLNALFAALISANIFLIGFLISGTLVDYKESEKLPGDMAASLETLADEGMILYKSKHSPEARNFLRKLSEFSGSLIDWFHKKERTNNVMETLRSFNDDFLAFESQTQPNFIVRLKQEQHSLRKMINRIHTIRETSFLGTGYAIAEIITSILAIGLIFVQMDPFFESAFFTSFISFIMIYMIFFIKDLDNPFGYNEEDSLIEEVSLKPILDSQKRIGLYYQKLSK